MTESRRAVFLSYASEDAEVAARICDALRSAGVEVWFDQSELRGGDAWDRQIKTQIHECALFMPIISATTQERLEGYFRREWRLAVDRTHDMADSRPFLVPIVIDDTKDRAAEVPDAFRSVQWTKLPAGETTAAFCERIRVLLGGAEQATKARVASGPAPIPLSKRATVRWKIGAALGVAAALVVGWQAWRLLRPNPGTAATAASASAVPEKSIAVLPFVDMSEKHDQEYFADGMAEEVLNLLVKIPNLKVIGRTSSFSFKGKTDDLRKIGTTLGAAYVVEGSVRRSGDHIRVTAQLIDTRNGTHRWSETYDRDFTDALRVQSDISSGLARALQLEVTGSDLMQRQGSMLNGEAYDSYLRGLHALNRFDQRGLEEAAAHFRRALVLDSSFAPAASMLARALVLQCNYGFVRPQVGFELARAAATAALKLDGKSALAHAILGEVYTIYDWNWVAADQEMNTALALAPSDPVVLVDAAELRLATGQWSEAERLLQASFAVDPLGASMLELVGYVRMRLGRYEDAEALFRRMLEIAPTYAWGHVDLGTALLIQKKTEAAYVEFQKEEASGLRMVGLALAYHALRRTKQADATLARLEAEYADTWAFGIAEVYAFRGDKDRALQWLDRAFLHKDSSMWVIKGDPLLKNLEDDPRYKAFLKKMNLPEA